MYFNQTRLESLLDPALPKHLYMPGQALTGAQLGELPNLV